MAQGSEKPPAKSSEAPMFRRNLLEKVVSAQEPKMVFHRKLGDIALLVQSNLAFLIFTYLCLQC